MNLYKSIPLFLLFIIASSVDARSIYADRFFFSGEYEGQYIVPKTAVRGTSNLSEQKIQGNVFNHFNYAWSINIGYRVNLFAIRAGYTHSRNIFNNRDYIGVVSQTIVCGGEVIQKNFDVYIDTLYYFKVTELVDFKALLGVGVLRSKSNSDLQVLREFGLEHQIFSVQSTMPGLRIGVGFERELNRYFSADVILKSQIPGNELYRYLVGLSIGISAHI